MSLLSKTNETIRKRERSLIALYGSLIFATIGFGNFIGLSRFQNVDLMMVLICTGSIHFASGKVRTAVSLSVVGIVSAYFALTRLVSLNVAYTAILVAVVSLFVTSVILARRVDSSKSR